MPLINIFPLPPALAVMPMAVIEDLSVEQLRCVKDTARFFGMGVEANGDNFVFSNEGSWVHLRNGWEPLSWGLVQVGHRVNLLLLSVPLRHFANVHLPAVILQLLPTKLEL